MWNRRQIFFAPAAVFRAPAGMRHFQLLEDPPSVITMRSSWLFIVGKMPAMSPMMFAVQHCPRSCHAQRESGVDSTASCATGYEGGGNW
jgi:hypothetical protein